MEKQISNLHKAVVIGMVCVISYLAVYVARNVLGAVTPSLIELGYSEEYVGQISSLFLIFYACGQLLNGFIGDRIKAKYMISLGLALAGIANFVFPFTIDSLGAAIAVYGISGFFLSMIYGPMTKFVSENVEEKYATRISVAYSFSAAFGAPITGVFAAILVWQGSFNVSGTVLVVMAVVFISSILAIERKSEVKYITKREKTTAGSGVKVLIKRRIILFALVSMLTGVVRTSVVFWLPTYFNQYLGFSPNDSAVMFTVATAVIAATPFITAFLYERMGRNMDKILLISFVIATATFVLTYLFADPIINVIFMILAIMGANGASTILWSMYCPSLYDTGMVSTATGFLDFLSYIAAAISNILFATAATTIGWGKLILVWAGIMALGIIATVIFRNRKDKSECEVK